MKITSSAFEHNGTIPPKYTCNGENINPPLSITELPEGTKSVALIVDDPDAPMGLWVHWTLWNMAPENCTIAEHSVPEGAVEGITSFAKAGYGGPCPPDGEHRYYFKAYALDIDLDLEPTIVKEELEEAMVGHVLDKAELMAHYDQV